MSGRSGKPQDPRYAKQYRLDRERGIVRMVDAERAQLHARLLMNGDGLSLRGVAEAAGLSPSGLSHIVLGQSKRIKTATEAAILAVTVEAVLGRDNPHGFVPNIGARRRIRALLALGWRHADITSRFPAGCRQTSQLVLHQAGYWINRSTHDAVKGVFDELSAHPGPSAKTRRWAAKLGYLPPLAWDDEAIDDPNGSPYVDDTDDFVDDVVVERALDGDELARQQLNKLEKAEALRRGIDDRGWSFTHTAEVLKMSGETATKFRHAHLHVEDQEAM